MIYEFKNSATELCKSVRHFFRAMFCKDFFYESHGCGMCGWDKKDEHFCVYWQCPKKERSRR